MKKTKVNTAMLIIVLVSISASIAFAGILGDGSKKFVLKPGTSGYTEVEWTYLKRVNVSAKADQGNVQINVVDGKGKRVASGTNKVSFKTGKEKMNYKIEFANKTSKIQNVITSWSF